MRIKDEILSKQKDFTVLCKTHKVKYLYAFGSSASERFDPDKSEKLLSLWDLFETFFNRKVDLLTDSSIRNPFLRKSIDSTKVLIYIDNPGNN